MLGHLRVVDRNGDEVKLSAPKLRTLLALLLVNRGRPVSVDRIADTLWGDLPPRSAANLVQGYIRDLRQRLGAKEVATSPEDTGWTPGGRLLMRSASRIWSSLAGMKRRWRCGTERPLRNVSTLPTRKRGKARSRSGARKLARHRAVECPFVRQMIERRALRAYGGFGAIGERGNSGLVGCQRMSNARRDIVLPAVKSDAARKHQFAADPNKAWKNAANGRLPSAADPISAVETLLAYAISSLAPRTFLASTPPTSVWSPRMYETCPRARSFEREPAGRVSGFRLCERVNGGKHLIKDLRPAESAPYNRRPLNGPLPTAAPPHDRRRPKQIA